MQHNKKKQRVGRLLRMHSNRQEAIDKAYAGDIVAVVGLTETKTGDTLCTQDKPIILESMDFPDPVISISIKPESNADSLRRIVKYIPDDALLVETDAPYLAPEPKRGKENEPSLIAYTIKKLSELKKISFEEIASLTSKNAKRLFNLDED